MALLHAMQAGHSSVEGGLKRILELLGEEAPVGEQSHADLVKRASREIAAADRARPPILPQDIARDLDETRRFRRRATHDYDNFDPERAAPPIEAARRLASSLKPCIPAFRDRIDPRI